IQRIGRGTGNSKLSSHVGRAGERTDAPGVEAQPIGSELVHRSEEHTSELQSPCNLVCRLLLEKKKKNYSNAHPSHCLVPPLLHAPIPPHLKYPYAACPVPFAILFTSIPSNHLPQLEAMTSYLR